MDFFGIPYSMASRIVRHVISGSVSIHDVQDIADTCGKLLYILNDGDAVVVEPSKDVVLITRSHNEDNWKARAFWSGVYFYRMEGDGYRMARLRKKALLWGETEGITLQGRPIRIRRK